MKRLITAAVLLPIFAASVLVPADWFFDLLLCVVAVICVLEFQGVTAGAGAFTFKLYATAFTLALLLQAIFPSLLTLEAVILISIFGIMVLAVLTKMEISRAVVTVTAAFFGPLYIGFLLRYPIFMHHEGYPEGAKLIFLLCGAVWLGDSAALYVGKAFGKHSLSKRLSPKKTWEGAIGNLFGTSFFVLAAKYTLMPSLTIPDAAVLGLLITMVGIGGDLFESLFKRSVGLKDTSDLLPGHGGMLDRLDSLFFNAPLVYYYFLLVLK